MTLEIFALDPFDDAATAAWQAAYQASTVFGREHATPWMLEEMRARFRADSPGEQSLPHTGLVDGEVAVTGLVELPMMDNLKQAWVKVDTHPRFRKHGHGSAMLEHLVDVAREHGRTIVSTDAAYPYDAPADGAGHPYVEFLLHRGFSFGLGDVQRVLNLPVDERLLERLADEAAPHHTGYQILQFRGPVPGDIIESFGELVGSLMTEAPQGEMEIEREVYDEARIRADEVEFEASGRTKYTTVAIASDGTVAAYTDLAVPRHDPGRVYQWGTLVSPEHRGHRLGLAVKAANLLLLQGDPSDQRLLVTYNAEVNAHMIAVNDLMGFRPVERLGEFQKKLA